MPGDLWGWRGVGGGVEAKGLEVLHESMLDARLAAAVKSAFFSFFA